MLHVLIVDDERYMAESVRADVNWETFGVDGVFLAFSIRQAKEVFAKQRIDIMLCDIEMPQGSGLELLHWVKEHSPKTECVFLTCHADFKYAQEAMQLGSLDYLLKPIPPAELNKAVRKAVDKVNKDHKLLEYSQLGEFWYKYQPLLVERFWLDIIHHSIPASPEAIKAAALERNIPFSSQMKLLPVLIDIQRYHKPLNQREEKILEFALRNGAEEKVLSREKGQVIALGARRLLTIFAAGQEGSCSRETLIANCAAYIDACSSYFYCDISCYIGESVYGHQLAAAVQHLLDEAKNNVSYTNKVFLHGESKPSPTLSLPDMDIWSMLLKEGAADKLLAEVEKYLEQLINNGGMDAATLNQFHHHFLQMAYYVLKVKGIEARQLFADVKSVELTSKAASSVVDMAVWVRHVIGRAADYAVKVEKAPSIVEKVSLTISQHLETETLSREELAQQVYLNPDYLDRIFKKETGMSVTDYLVQERMKLAQQLLAKTDLSIGAIAVKAGYSNLSHFSRRFKQLFGIGPNDYRQQRS
jgi:two-component system, response regulator YesN